jgi:hypothetical protein
MTLTVRVPAADAGFTLQQVYTEPKLSPEHTWCKADYRQFNVRVGPDYPRYKKKAPSAAPIYEPFAVDVFWYVFTAAILVLRLRCCCCRSCICYERTCFYQCPSRETLAEVGRVVCVSLTVVFLFIPPVVARSCAPTTAPLVSSSWTPPPAPPSTSTRTTPTCRPCS